MAPVEVLVRGLLRRTKERRRSLEYVSKKRGVSAFRDCTSAGSSATTSTILSVTTGTTSRSVGSCGIRERRAAVRLGVPLTGEVPNTFTEAGTPSISGLSVRKEGLTGEGRVTEPALARWAKKVSESNDESWR